MGQGVPVPDVSRQGQIFIWESCAEKSRIIKLPLFIFDNAQLVKDTEAKLEKQLQRTPTNAEIARQTELKENNVKFLRASVQPVESLENINPALLYLPETKYEDEISRTIDIKQLRRFLYANLFISKLTPLERKMVASRFNLGKKSDKTKLKELGKKHNITRERVRQLILHGIEKIHNAQKLHSNNFKLEEFTEYQNLSD